MMEAPASTCTSSSSPRSPPPVNDVNNCVQRDALKTIYQCLEGTQWTIQTNWLSNDDHCSTWSGVRCNANRQVTALELSHNNLRGRLDDPAMVSALLKLGSSLEQLWLSENSLQGNLPSCLASTDAFPHLSIIDVGSNKLRGSLHLGFRTASTQFSWFDISSNQLTSYYRYCSTSDNVVADAANTLTLITNPLSNVYVAPSLLTKQQGANLVDHAIRYTSEHANNGGWQMDRHQDYKTTDIDIAICGGEILDCCNDHLRTTILPLLSRLFGFPTDCFAVEDLFLAKYSANKGQQSALSQHRDGSELSFVITLNDPATDFTGGGTKFIMIDDAKSLTLAPQSAGTGIFFCGRQLHSGVEVKTGTRYILAGFVRVFASTPKQEQKLDGILKQYSASV